MSPESPIDSRKTVQEIVGALFVKMQELGMDGEELLEFMVQSGIEDGLEEGQLRQFVAESINSADSNLSPQDIDDFGKLTELVNVTPNKRKKGLEIIKSLFEND